MQTTRHCPRPIMPASPSTPQATHISFAEAPRGDLPPISSPVSFGPNIFLLKRYSPNGSPLFEISRIRGSEQTTLFPPISRTQYYQRARRIRSPIVSFPTTLTYRILYTAYATPIFLGIIEIIEKADQHLANSIGRKLVGDLLFVALCIRLGLASL